MAASPSTTDVTTDVRRSLFTNNVAAMATLSVNDTTRGFPFGSLVPYALDEAGRPLILISDIAQHTKNLIADPRASLLVQDKASDDPQAGWRITLVGSMERLEEGAEHETGHARYVAQVPDAPSYYDAHGFGLWRMDVVRVRYIGGFGRIYWVEADDYLRAAGHGGFAKAGAAVVDEMNRDHADALIDYCKGLRATTPTRVEMVAVEAAGFFVRTHEPDDLLYFPFGEEIDAKHVRDEFVELLERARKQ